MIDILEHINAIHRHVSRTSEDVSVLLRRSYSGPVEDVWDALTDPERMRRWFMPITGELKIGGSFQLEGNAGGERAASALLRALRTPVDCRRTGVRHGYRGWAQRRHRGITGTVRPRRTERWG